MRKYLRHLVFACLLSTWLSTTAHATYEYIQPAINTGTTANQMIAQSPEQYPLADELWLIGSFLVSLTGLVILVRFLRH